MADRQVKQVIVVRKDLNMRRGKEIAQGAHASIAWITNRMKEEGRNKFSLKLSEEEVAWVEGSFAKVTVRVNSEEELLEVYQKAKEKGLTAVLITDSGRTEFGGVPTKTCCAIGPHFEEAFSGITDHLTLY